MEKDQALAIVLLVAIGCAFTGVWITFGSIGPALGTVAVILLCVLFNRLDKK